MAYVELLPGVKNPFSLLLSEEEEEEEKNFFSSLGFLNRMEGGFCLLSAEGVWHFQEMRQNLQFKRCSSHRAEAFIDAGGEEERPSPLESIGSNSSLST